MVNWTSQGTILITGAAQRVGLHCLQRLLEKGERVAMTYRSERPEIAELRERGAICLQVDFTEQSSVERLIRRLKEEVGPLRALIHNASSWAPDRSEDTDYRAVMQDMVAIHMTAPYLLNMHCYDLLEQGRNPWSDIIHISDYVVEKGSDNHIAYAAAKGGMESMTRSFAKRYAPHIKVNTIAPSLLMFNDGDDPDYRTKTLRKSALGIEPGPDVVWQAIAFILDCSYMTGREIKLDGGRHIR
ncbi:dihydromonapterin reductase [Hahella sp. HN01]|uniref:dihydromonapterin reductase n=1 Tax=Hahella sp. HN01 TaxID=2847262 RepID=UPI001C1EE54B|nr:dihydromonapterin reductase [Hahella sp. HN01]